MSNTQKMTRVVAKVTNSISRMPSISHLSEHQMSYCVISPQHTNIVLLKDIRICLIVQILTHSDEDKHSECGTHSGLLLHIPAVCCSVWAVVQGCCPAAAVSLAACTAITAVAEATST